ncbi:MAG: glycosyltransferase family 2 protein [Anaerolineales bacterium]|nr:glycosyltransferase family 2 protein [Anaerolineales bacterium]
MQSLPLISVIIVVWNSKKHLAACLGCLLMQTLGEFEIILVDNGSEDGALDELRDKYSSPDLHIHRLSSNLGFAAANNIGARLARGKWLALLNADAYPEPDWLKNLLNAAQQNPEYTTFSSRQLQYNRPDLLDGAGDEYHVSGLAWRRYYNHTEKDHGFSQEEVFGACAAAAMYRREDFLRVGGFDEDYFSYFEDVDLSFRLRLAGGRCLYVPKAIVHHVGSASTGKISDFVIYHGHRNLVWTFLKDMPALLFWLYLPLHLLMNLYFLVSFTVKGKGRAIFKAKWDAIKHIPAVLKKRKMMQSQRRASLSEIHRLMSKGLLTPYWASRQRKKANGRNQ